MTENGVSKKLVGTGAGIVFIANMAEGSENKLPFVIVIGILCIVHELVQGYLDKRKS